MSQELRQLVDQCIDNDQSAMVRLVDRFRGRVFGLCYRMVGQWQDAEDMVQETFVRVMKNLARWDSTREFEPWLLTIAANRCRSFLARRNRRPATESFFEYMADDHSAMHQQTAGHLDEEIHLVLSMMRDELRQAFWLFHGQQLSYAEISTIMNRPVGTVKTWVHRARRELIFKLQRREVLRESSNAL